MSVKIRLSKIGKTNAPAFRIVVAQTRDKRNGKPLDVLGHYNPSHTPALFDIDKEKYQEWIEKGAQVTDAVVELVEGTYEFQPYTRQNEPQEGGEEGSTEKTEETEKEDTAETAQPEEASAEEKSEE